MNDITTTTNVLTTTVEKVLSQPTNTSTAILIIVGLGLGALLISKAMDNGYAAEISVKDGILKFDKAAVR